MNPQEKIENSYTSNEEVTRSPSFESLTSGFPFPDFMNNYYHASHGGVVLQQAHHSNNQNSLSGLLNGSTQLLQPPQHRDLHHQTIPGKMTNFNYESSGKLDAASSIYFPTDCQAQNNDNVGSLQSKGTSLDLACMSTRAGHNSDLSWGVGGSKHGEMFYSSNSQIGTTAVHGSMQSCGAATGKQRIRWTHELHEQFVEAVNHLGGAMKATPKGILALMKSQGLTIFHIKSHLQKYRTAKRMPNFLGGISKLFSVAAYEKLTMGPFDMPGKNWKRINNDMMPSSNFRGHVGLQISETLRMQMDVQKSLHDHLEFQKKLQMRIEEHANYLGRMFDQQKRSCSFFENHNSTKVDDTLPVKFSRKCVLQEIFTAQVDDTLPVKFSRKCVLQEIFTAQGLVIFLAPFDKLCKGAYRCAQTGTVECSNRKPFALLVYDGPVLNTLVFPIAKDLSNESN
ncbi:putative protein PHOSPHATE STARVATION RESPONSE 2 [Cocos nucifera]|uniref:HTH myb-type domain-containing protein n=1 Tax=Cocos nucifera TaxID=13894 RepID=A0A8K0N4J4_COCNU|nr:putative protein PHOSPHATE STARVATION RESPONSE 2 [Cocos nucifera]